MLKAIKLMHFGAKFGSLTRVIFTYPNDAKNPQRVAEAYRLFLKIRDANFEDISWSAEEANHIASQFGQLNPFIQSHPVTLAQVQEMYGYFLLRGMEQH